MVKVNKTKIRPGCGLGFTLTVFLILGAPTAVGRPATRAQPAASATITLDRVQAKIKEIEENERLEDPLKGELLTHYQQARSHLEAALSYESQIASYKQAIASAPGEIERIRKAIEEKSATKPVTPEEMGIAKMPLPELEQRLIIEQADLAALKDKQGGFKKQLQEQRARPRLIKEELAAAKLREIEQDLKTPLAQGKSPLVSEARQLALEARRQAQAKEINGLDQELVSHSIRLELLTAQYDLSAQEVSLAGTRVKLLEDRIAKQREAEAKQAQLAAARMERAAAGKHPAIRELAEQNVELSRQLSSVIEDSGKANAVRERLDGRLKQIEQDFQSARQKLEIAGLSDALGQILQEQRRDLPHVRHYQQAANKRQKRIAELGLRQIAIDEQHRALSDPGRVLARIMRQRVSPSLPLAQRQEIEAELRGLLKDQQGLLKTLDEAYASYLQALGDLDFTERQLIDSAQHYAAFLDERLLWIPNAAPLRPIVFRDLAKAAGWLLAPSHWAEVGYALRAEVKRFPGLMFLILLGLGFLVRVQGRLRTGLAALAEKMAKPYSDRFLYTLEALGMTVLLAVPAPLVLGFLRLAA